MKFPILAALAACVPPYPRGLAGLPTVDTATNPAVVVPTEIRTDRYAFSCVRGEWHPSVQLYGTMWPDSVLVTAVETGDLGEFRKAIAENHWVSLFSAGDPLEGQPHTYDALIPVGSETAIPCDLGQYPHHGSGGGVTYAVFAYGSADELADCVIFGHDAESFRDHTVTFINIYTEDPADVDSLRSCRVAP